jgi:hypothetical protein
VKRVAKNFLAGAGLVAVALFHPQSLPACAACYGASDSPLAQGMNWGIAALLVVVGGVLAGISLFFVHISRRAAIVDAEAAAQLPSAKN